MSLQATVDQLRQLVACDTQNPPRQINGDDEIFQLCNRAVGSGFSQTTWDHGDGHVSWFAAKGNPKVLFNVHLDTVPVDDGWAFDPHDLQIRDGRAYGRGACDIKGAAAVLLTLAQQDVDHLALLFTSDEEGGGGCCVDNFLKAGHADRFGQIIVAEPTQCEAILAHRGFLSVKTRFFGTPGHSSEARALTDNANHQMAIWAADALGIARKRKHSDEDPGSCMNMGRVEGGTKSNVIAGEAFMHWSARLKPGDSNKEFLSDIQACVPQGARVEWEVPFSGHPLPASGQDSEMAKDFCNRAGMSPAQPVDFWTEAALFSAAGLAAMVLGPGDIAQAHVTDEWVALSQLERAYELYGSLVKDHG